MPRWSYDHPLDRKIWLPEAILKTAESCLWESVSSAFSELAAYAIPGQSTQKDRDLITLIKQVNYFVPTYKQRVNKISVCVAELFYKLVVRL